MTDDVHKLEEPDLEDRRKVVIRILNWLAGHRLPQRVSRLSIVNEFQPARRKAKRPIRVEQVDRIGELAKSLGFESHNGLYPAPGNDRSTDEVERDLRRLYDIDESDESWQAYCEWNFDQFVKCYINEHKDNAVRRGDVPATPVNPTSRETNRLLAQVPRAEVHSFVSEVLASVDLTLKQSPAGEPWPVIGELRCGIAVIGGYNIAIGRCWVQVDGGPICEVTFDDSETRHVSSNHGQVALTWVGGSKGRPVCNVEGLAGLIGRIELPDDFCKVHQLAHGDIVTLRVAVFVGDLERVTSDDDGVPAADRSNPDGDSISFRRKDYQTMGKAAKAAVRQVLAEKQALEGNKSVKPLPGESEGWWVVAEARRRLIDPTDKG